MRQLLRIVCLFQGHEPVPCSGLDSFFYDYSYCQRCSKSFSRFRDDVKIEWVPDDVWHLESPWNREGEVWT